MTSSSAGSASSDEQVGNTLSDRYLIEEVLGMGGMSTVYRASDAALGRTVALKVFRADLADADDLRRQQSEIQLLASLNHSTLVTLYDAITDEADRVALVLEYVEGRDLRDELAAGGIDERTTAMIGADIADALNYVHARGIVHRDLKPGNLLIPTQTPGSTGPRAKLTDFGIARIIDDTHLTAAGSVIGTVGYLSPEQALGAPIGPASDVYSLGLVLLECLTGARAFGGTGVEAIAARISRDPEIPASLSQPWIEALGRMTRRTPDERATAAEASELLSKIALSLPAESPGELPGELPGEQGADTPTIPFTPLTPADVTAPHSHDSDDSTAAVAAGDSDPTAAHNSGRPVDAATAVMPTAMSGFAGSNDTTAAFGGSNDATARYATATPPAASAASAAPSTSATSAASAGRSAPTTPARDRGTRPNRRRLVTVIAAIAALFIVGSAIGALVVQGQANEPAEATIEYPSVDGELGSHLEQLQGSVTP
ncbi:serine/threonine protein kinase [Marisediminicola sp. UYEF4]|uniref:serine/threonine-protein kinase n=1 Tax=Marisediminicola sp. UYEF4 TaxID=1756384 RepID=UPI0033977ACC